MKPAIIFSLPMVTSEGICWRWRSVDGKTDSTKSFADYNECLGNAVINGYFVKIAPSAGNGYGPGKQYGATRR